MHVDENDFEIFGLKLDSGFRSFTLNFHPFAHGKKFISQFFFTIILLFFGFLAAFKCIKGCSIFTEGKNKKVEVLKLIETEIYILKQNMPMY